MGGYATAGIDYDRLNLGSGTLTLGGTSTLVLDLAGLSTTGTATGAVVFGGVVGTFTTVTLINNPNSYSATLNYNATSIDVVIASPILPAAHYKFNKAGNRVADAGKGLFRKAKNDIRDRSNATSECFFHGAYIVLARGPLTQTLEDVRVERFEAIDEM